MTHVTTSLLRGRSHFFALFLYALLTFVSFLPQSAHPWDTIAYSGDALESVYLVGWNVHQIFHDPLHLFDTNTFHPHSGSLAFTDHRLLPSMLVAPVVWITSNYVLAYNAAVALACLFAAMSGRYLARRLGMDEIGAWAAGALYAYHSYQVNEAPRLNIIFHGFLPLALWQSVLYLRTGRPKHAFFAAGWMLLQGYSSNYHLLYGGLLLGLVSLCLLLLQPTATLKRIPLLAGTALIAAALYVPIALPYVSHSNVYEWSREPPLGIDLEHYFSTTRTNIMHGPIGAETRIQQRGPHFIGYFSLASATLAIISWIFGVRGNNSNEALLPERLWVPLVTVMAILFIVLSLGKEIVVFGRTIGPGPYLILYNWVPGFQLVRIPERLSLLAMLLVALLVGRGLTILRRVRGWTVACVLLAAVIPLEHVSTLPVSERIRSARRSPPYIDGSRNSRPEPSQRFRCGGKV